MKYKMSSPTICILLAVELEQTGSCDNINLNEKSCTNRAKDNFSQSDLLQAVQESVKFSFKLLADCALADLDSKTGDNKPILFYLFFKSYVADIPETEYLQVAKRGKKYSVLCYNQDVLRQSLARGITLIGEHDHYSVIVHVAQMESKRRRST